jgi:hypothetical protein
LVLLECDIDPSDVVLSLNQLAGQTFHHAVSPAGTGTETIRVFTRFPKEMLISLRDSSRFTIRHMLIPGRASVIVAAVHFPSKLYWSEDSQALECTEFARAIVEVEKEAGHDRTVLVGDLNMNPFESGMVGAVGLNATMARDQAAKGFRTVQGRQYPFFYNPMWGHFGDRDRNPAGTYYRDSGHHVNYYWNMFDQVLIRPSLLDMFPADGVEIVTHAGRTPLLTASGVPDRAIGSDHLPLLFRLGA